MSEALQNAVLAMREGIANRSKAAFPLPDNRFHKHARKRDELAARRGVKKLVRPENAAVLLAHLPAPGEITHAVLRGDFVLGDALPALLALTGPSPHLRISTLALSTKNAETLRALVQSGTVGKLTLICSHYFRAVDKLSTFRAVAAVLDEIAELKISRCHAKIILLPTARGAHLVFEGSANLRSSDTVEQLTIFNDPEILSFHASWMDEVQSMPFHAGK